MLPVIVCGLILAGVFADHQNRIIEGQDADPGEYPHQVSLQFGSKFSHFCGGSIIGLYWILTAAHCVHKTNMALVTVWVGTNKLDRGGTRYFIRQTIYHEQFNHKNLKNDIALIQLTQNVVLSNKVQIIPLANNVPPDNVICRLSGWGYTSFETKTILNNLQELELKKMPLKKCRMLLSGLSVFSSNTCGFKRKGQGACNGDSGGALLYDRTQIGIVSWGILCADGKPDVFTSVSSFRGWIREKTGI